MSMGTFLFIVISYILYKITQIQFWKILFYSIAFLTAFGMYFYFKNIDCKFKINKNFLINIYRNGFYSLGSFLIMWCATQGVFVVFYGDIDDTAFVEQKLLFSVLGFFNIIMIVQENKYQPLYAKSIVNSNIEILNNYDKAVNRESYILLFFCSLIVVIFYISGYEFYISFFIFFQYIGF